MKARFFDALEKRVGATDIKTGFSSAQLKAMVVDDGDPDQWMLVVPSKFQAKWVEDNFIHALEHASRRAGFTKLPRIQAARDQTGT